MGVALYATTTCARTKFHQGVLLHLKNPTDLSPRAEQHKCKSLAGPSDPLIKVLEIVYSDDRRGFATTLQDMAHMYNTYSQGCWSTGGSSQCKKIKMYGAEPHNGTLVYVDGEVETMQDRFSLQKSDLKMTGIPLIPREIPKEPLLKFIKRLSILQGTLARLQPSFVLILRILIAYTPSVVDYVFLAIPMQAEWVQSQQIQIKRMVCKALCIPIRTPNKMLWAGLDHMGFAVPHVFTRPQCQYIKGLFLACNSRSTYTRETTTMLMLYSKPNVTPHPDWIIAQQWIAQHGTSFHLPANLTECPIRIEVQHIPEGDIILMSDGSKETYDHAWSTLVIDINGVALKASSAVRCKGGSSWIAEWCGKFLNMLLMHCFETDPNRIKGAIPTTWQPCTEVKAANRPNASELMHTAWHTPSSYANTISRNSTFQHNTTPRATPVWLCGRKKATALPNQLFSMQQKAKYQCQKHLMT